MIIRKTSEFSIKQIYTNHILWSKCNKINSWTIIKYFFQALDNNKTNNILLYNARSNRILKVELQIIYKIIIINRLYIKIYVTYGNWANLQNLFL